MINYRWTALALAGAFCVFCCPGLVAGQAATAPAVREAVVLDTHSFWRMHQTLQPPVARVGGELKPLLVSAAWVDQPTASAPEDWMKPEFDDHDWLRGPARLTSPTPYVARLCLRGKFILPEGKAQGLRLSVEYHGGAIIYVNGRELVRSHVAAGAAAVAEDYPASSFLTAEGKLLGFEAARRTVRGDDPRVKAIRRGIADVEIPADVLRPGVNVLAISILRAAYPGVVDEKRDAKARHWNFAWDTCQLVGVRLIAADAAGIVSAARRPAGFQVWNSNLLAADYDLDFGDPAERLQAVRISGTRNGSFSGKVVVGDSKAIRGLRATAGDLRGPAGVIAAANVRLRYGFAWGREEMVIYYGVNPYPADARLLAGLSDQPPDEVALSARKARDSGRADPAPGAVAPVWITVNVPRDAKPGAYKGQVTIQAEGVAAVTVPVELQVEDFVLPSPQDRQTMVEILQSPDTLAMEYGEELWSERHWKLIGESFRLLSDSGSRFVYVPLIAETNQGHAESMVRWIRRADGGYDYDFSIMDKYLEVAEKNLGKPRHVVLYVWDVYMSERAQEGFDAQWHAMREKIGQGGVYAQGPVVTAYDPATKKTERLVLPRYVDEGSAALWKPLYEQLQTHLAKRGLEKSVMLGMITDIVPNKADTEFMAKMLPGAGWVAHTHSFSGNTLHRVAPVPYKIAVWSIANASDKSLMGWKRGDMLTRYWRQAGFDAFPSAQWRHVSEFAITGNQRGTGRLGGDFWPAVRDKAGARQGRVYVRYPQSNWRNLDVYTSLLCPAPHGPAATQHYLHLLEGTQEAEARIVIERALSNPEARGRLGEELAARCESALEERLRAMQRCYSQLNNRLDSSPHGISSTCGPGTAAHFWFTASGWEARAATLYALAGEVARKVDSR